MNMNDRSLHEHRRFNPHWSFIMMNRKKASNKRFVALRHDAPLELSFNGSLIIANTIYDFVLISEERETPH